MKIARLNSTPEIFHSVQGEGASIGSAAIFLRLAGCNLRCDWCDTSYSWNAFIELSTHEVIDLIEQHNCRQLVITGGEPLMQQEELEQLLRALPDDFYIEVETNGTLLPTPYLFQRVDQWNVSPKLAHAGVEDALQPDILRHLAEHPNCWFKFVIQQESDWEEIAPLALPSQRIILMPCATSRDELRAARPTIVALAIQYGVRFGDRLHLELWDKKKGV